MILVGGQKQDQHYLDSLYHLKDGDKSWTLMDKKLKIARSFHTAFFVSDCPHVAENHVVEGQQHVVQETTTMSETSEQAFNSTSTDSNEEEEVESTTTVE